MKYKTPALYTCGLSLAKPRLLARGGGLGLGRHGTRVYRLGAYMPTAVSIRILRGHLLAARAFRKYQNVRGNTLSNTLAVTSKPSISDYWFGISCLCNLVHVASFLCQVSTNPVKLRRRRRELRPFFWGM